MNAIRKKTSVTRLLLVGLAIGVLVGYVWYDRHKYMDSEVQEVQDVRRHYDVLNAGEVNLEKVSDKYLFDVKGFLDTKEGKKSVLRIIKSMASDEDFAGDRIYVSQRPIYFWNAARSNVDTARMEIAFFNQERSQMGVCYVLFRGNYKVLDVEGRVYENFSALQTNRQQKFIAVSVSGPGVPSEELLLSDENAIVTSYNGAGQNAFPVTVEGEYYHRISKVKELAFSLSDLLQKENLIEILVE